ncbi:MAG: hypothetical protein AB7F86_07090 [Bdellovibrionales bacterium]
MKTEALSLKFLLLIQAAVGLSITFLYWILLDWWRGASFGLGALAMWVNLFLIAWVWDRLIAKKSIAWTVLVIVMKYTILLGGIFLLTRTSWFHSMSAGLGMASFVIVVLIQMAALMREN